MRAAVTVPTPVWPNLPTSSAFIPLVFLVAAIAAGLFAWTDVGLSSTKAAWGLAGLQVLWPELRTTGVQYGVDSPLFAWSTAAALAIPLGSIFWRLPLPGFLYFLLSLLLLYRISRRWYSPGTGLIACFIFGVNREILSGIRTGGPGTCVLFSILLLIWCFLRHERTEERFSIWLVASVGAVALLVLSSGTFAGWILLLVLLVYFHVELHRRREPWQALKQAFRSSTFWSGVAVAALGVLLAAPWLVGSGQTEVSESTLAQPTGIGKLVVAMPATFVLALFGFWRSAKASIRGGPETATSALLAIWTFVGCLALQVSPTKLALPFALVPMAVLAARSYLAVLNRKISDRQILGLTLCTCFVFILVLSPVTDDMASVLMGKEWLTADTMLRFHYTVDVLVLTLAIAAACYHFSAAHDRYRRRFAGVFAVLVLVGASLPVFDPLIPDGDMGEVWQKVYNDLLPYQDREQIVLVGEQPPSVQLDFVLRSVLPHAEIERVDALTEVEEKIHTPVSQSLVLVTSPTSQLPTSTPVGQGTSQVVLTRVFANEAVAAYVETPADQTQNPGAVRSNDKTVVTVD